MAKDVIYTNGVIAVKETALLGNRLTKLAEMSADEAFRTVADSGFGRGAEADSVFAYEKLLSADEKDLDAFIRDYSPSSAESAYFLAERDFHNAKAAVKALITNSDNAEMYAPDGTITAEEIERGVRDGDYSAFYPELAKAVNSAVETSENENGVSGAKLGELFDNALYSYLFSVCRKKPMLKKLLQKKADMTNILTAMRSKTGEYAANNMIRGGKLSLSQIEKIFNQDEEKILSAFFNTDYYEFVNICLEAKKKGLPFTEAELISDNLEINLLESKKYELKNSQPFLYYVFRRRAENLNLRVVFVCLLAGMDENSIKKRLRTAF